MSSPTDYAIDALPYVDLQYGEPGMKEYVDKLIEEEMKRMPAKDYLGHLPPVPELKFENTLFLAAEFERISQGKPMQKLDLTRYALDPPKDKAAQDVNAWQQAVNNARSQIEYQQNKLMNLELLNTYGADAWKAFNKTLEGMQAPMRKALEETRKEIDEINRKRKIDQVEAGRKLMTLETQWHETVFNNIALEKECAKLEKKLRMLTQKAEENGLIKKEGDGETTTSSSNNNNA